VTELDADDGDRLRTATSAAYLAAVDIRSATDAAVEVTVDMREATGDARTATTDAREATERSRETDADVRRVDSAARRSSADARDATANTRDATADTREASADTREATADTREATADSRDATADSRDATADTRDATADTRDAAADTRDATAGRLFAEDLQRSNDKLRRLDRLKSEFVAMASHELRTPLASITGFSSTMLELWDTIPEEDKFHYVEIIDGQSKRLARLVEDLLTVSNIESGEIRTTPVAINIRNAVEQAIRELGVDGIVVACDEDIEAYADADHVQQILVNFISNAIKYGAAPIHVDTVAEEGGVCIRVTDAGVGVPAPFVPHLFERFSRSGDSQAADGTGTGLGLSITDGLARAQGGTVWYEPHAPTGARFVVRLPWAPTRG
jgi:signal transduction histidine kinase